MYSIFSCWCTLQRTTLHAHCTIHETEKEGRAVGPSVLGTPWQQSRESVRNRLILISCMFDQLRVPKKNRSSVQQSDKRSVGSRYQSSLTQGVLCLVSRMGSMHTETLEGRNLATIHHHRASNCTYTKSVSYQPYCFKWHKCSE